MDSVGALVASRDVETELAVVDQIPVRALVSQDTQTSVLDAAIRRIQEQAELEPHHISAFSSNV
jgi:hypothetical protein